MEFFIGIALLLPISALAIQAYESDFDDDRCDFLWKSLLMIDVSLPKTNISGDEASTDRWIEQIPCFKEYIFATLSAMLSCL